METSTLKLWPCTPRHLWPCGAFGSVCAASKVKSFVNRARMMRTISLLLNDCHPERMNLGMATENCRAAALSDSALRRAPDELVHLKLKPHIEFIGEDPFDDFARIDPAENRGE